MYFNFVYYLLEFLLACELVCLFPVKNTKTFPSRSRLSITQHHFHFGPKILNESQLREWQMNLIHKLSTLTPLPMAKVQPPDHIDAVKLEHDGDLNNEYRKELLLGSHDEFKQDNTENDLKNLQDIFHLADTNNDSFVNLEELNSWIIAKVQGHLNESEESNEEVFNHLDTDRDGNVTWEEFNVHFLLAKGYSLEKAVSIASNQDGFDDVALTPEEKERLIRYKFRWADADEGGHFGTLDVHEMMNFRHPEQSLFMIEKMAKDLLDKFDTNEDGIIIEQEFINPTYRYQPDDIEEETKRRRSIEFKNFIDLNKDGYVDLDEMKSYVDPRNMNRILSETQNLIQMADENKDGKLSLDEVLDNFELFLGSKMLDASRNFHDEF